MVRPLQAVFDRARRIGKRVVDPLRRGEGPNKFRLSRVDTATTTYHGSVGWANRPPAMLECPQCGTDVRQGTAHEEIDCLRCTAAFPPDEFDRLSLLYMECPACRSRMFHGQRHPDRFDVPEWATCDDCRYHWEFEHAY